MRLFLVSVTITLLLPLSGCASTKASGSTVGSRQAKPFSPNVSAQAKYDRRKEVFDERYDWMRSTGADYSHQRVPSSMISSNRNADTLPERGG